MGKCKEKLEDIREERERQEEARENIKDSKN